MEMLKSCIIMAPCNKDRAESKRTRKKNIINNIKKDISNLSV